MREIPVEAELVPDAAGQTKVPSNSRLLFILGVIGLAVLICCGGCGGFGFYMVWMIEKENAQEVAEKYASHPDVVREIGQIRECKPNLGAVFVDDPDEDWDSVYEVVGTNGQGQFMVYELFGLHLRVQLRTAKGKWELIEQDEDDADSSTDEDAEMDEELNSDSEAEMDLSEFPDLRQQGFDGSREAPLGSKD